MLDQLKAFGACMAGLARAAHASNERSRARAVALAAMEGFTEATMAIGAAQNCLDVRVRWPATETLTALWAAAKKEFGAELPRAKWFGQGEPWP